jgi:hypothetical protein
MPTQPGLWLQHCNRLCKLARTDVCDSCAGSPCCRDCFRVNRGALTPSCTTHYFLSRNTVFTVVRPRTKNKQVLSLARSLAKPMVVQRIRIKCDKTNDVQSKHRLYHHTYTAEVSFLCFTTCAACFLSLRAQQHTHTHTPTSSRCLMHRRLANQSRQGQRCHC